MKTHEPPHDLRLRCSVSSLSYDFVTRSGELHFPPDCCCDATGAIALFVGIDPGVRLIRTYAGDEADTVYQKRAGRWTAYNPVAGWTSRPWRHKGRA
jgi:hypothetical protein